jgi:hypothetical protein
MTTSKLAARRERLRHLLFMTNAALWPAYPFLPVVRRSTEVAEECGLMFDARGLYDLYGYSSTVFVTNLFTLPRTLPEFLALPKCVFDSADEVFDAGWRID